MVTFRKTISVTKNQTEWIKNELEKLEFDDNYVYFYHDAFFDNDIDSDNFEEKFTEIDELILEAIEDNEDDNLDIINEDFEKWKTERNRWLNEFIKYKDIFKDLGFDFDIFPNFEILIYDEEIEFKALSNYKGNPFVLAVFLQFYIAQWCPLEIIKIPYWSDTDDDQEMTGGILEVSLENISILTLEMLSK